MAEDRKKALIRIQRDDLVNIMRDYFDPGHDWDDFCLKYTESGLTRDASRFAAKAAREKLRTIESFREDRIMRFEHHPFDTRWAYISYTRPLWSEPIPMLKPHYWKGNAFIVSRMNTQAKPEGAPLCYSVNLFDRQFTNRNPQCIPIFLHDEYSAPKMLTSAQQRELFSNETTASIKANLSPAARAYLASIGLPDPDTNQATAKLIWYHALAIGYSPVYLAENADGIRQDWPRIPLPKPKDLLAASAALGRQVAALLDTDASVPGVTAGKIRDDLKSIAVFKRLDGKSANLEAGDLDLTAGWGHAGKGGVTMPGKGKLIRREDGAWDIFLNDIACWRNVPETVWDYTIGGYQVIKKWLSYREKPLLGRGLTPDEVRYVTEIARRLATLIALQASLDANYREVIQTTYPWTNQ
jgi:hypothetical protein